MAVGKNKRLSKKGKGAKKRLGDVFLKKDWYDVKAPSNFKVRQVGKTLVSKTQGTKIATDGLKGRVFELSLADMVKGGEVDAYRKIKLKCEEIQGTSCLTTFHGMDFTRDRHCYLIRKRQTLVEAHVDVKTTDGYALRVFVMGFTKRSKAQKDNPMATAYAKTAQVKQIRKKMVEIVNRETSSCDMKELVNKFIHEFIGKEIEKACEPIYPLQDVHIRKVKILRAPKFDIAKLMDMHGGPDVAGTAAMEEDVGETVERPAEPIPGMEEESDKTAATS